LAEFKLAIMHYGKHNELLLVLLLGQWNKCAGNCNSFL